MSLAFVLLLFLLEFVLCLIKAIDSDRIDPYSIPAKETDPAARSHGITANRAGFLYGPSPLGNVSYFLTGPLGEPVVDIEVDMFVIEAESFAPLIESDAKNATQAVLQVWTNVMFMGCASMMTMSGWRLE